jgi:hypothetical protein
LRKKREKYSDAIFLPTLTSLVNCTKKHNHKDWEAFEWKRISEVFKGNKISLYEEISPLTMSPAHLNNYGLLSAMAALAEYPSTIHHLISVFFNKICL